MLRRNYIDVYLHFSSYFFTLGFVMILQKNMDYEVLTNMKRYSQINTIESILGIGQINIKK